MINSLVHLYHAYVGCEVLLNCWFGDQQASLLSHIFYNSWLLTNADKAIEEEWQMYCEEELAKDSTEGEDKAPQA